MNKKIVFFILLTLFTSCHNEAPKTKQNDDSPFEQTTKTSLNIDQSIATNAKEIVKQNEEVIQVEAINSIHALVIGFKVNYIDRFRLKKIRQQIEKEIRRAYPTIDTVVSTDKKILIELEKINKRVDEQSISTNDLQRRVREIVRLSRDET